MGTRVSASAVKSAAAVIELELPDDEIEPVRERLQALLDATETFAHLTENTAELDLRFDARWEVEPA